MKTSPSSCVTLVSLELPGSLTPTRNSIHEKLWVKSWFQSGNLVSNINEKCLVMSPQGHTVHLRSSSSRRGTRTPSTSGQQDASLPRPSSIKIFTYYKERVEIDQFLTGHFVSHFLRLEITRRSQMTSSTRLWKSLAVSMRQMSAS